MNLCQLLVVISFVTVVAISTDILADENAYRCYVKQIRKEDESLAVTPKSPCYVYTESHFSPRNKMDCCLYSNESCPKTMVVVRIPNDFLSQTNQYSRHSQSCGFANRCCARNFDHSAEYKYNITLACSDGRILKSEEHAFTRKDEVDKFFETRPWNLKISNITATSAVLDWEMLTCDRQLSLKLKQLDNGGGDNNQTVENLISVCEQNTACDVPTRVAKAIFDLLPFTEYVVEARQKYATSQRWGVKKTATFRTREAVPLKGPVLLPGAFNATSCHSNVAAINITIRWKNVDDDVLRGKLTAYSVKISRPNNFPGDIFYNSMTSSPQTDVYIAVNSSAVDSELMCNKIQFSVEICSFNSIGKSMECTDMTINLYDVSLRMKSVKMESVDNCQKARLTQIPDDTEFVTFYYEDCVDSSGIVDWQSLSIADVDIFDVVECGDLEAHPTWRLVGISADAISVMPSLLQTSGIVQPCMLPVPTPQRKRKYIPFGLIALATAVLLASIVGGIFALILRKKKSRTLSNELNDSNDQLNQPVILTPSEIYYQPLTLSQQDIFQGGNRKPIPVIYTAPPAVVAAVNAQRTFDVPDISTSEQGDQAENDQLLAQNSEEINTDPAYFEVTSVSSDYNSKQQQQKTAFYEEPEDFEDYVDNVIYQDSNDEVNL